MPEEKNPFDTPEQVQARKDQEDPWVMYLIVRESLNMGAGKIGAQCGHAVGMIFQSYYGKLLQFATKPKPDWPSFISFEAWCNESYRKIVLKADDKEWEKVKAELSCFVVRDAGLTEVQTGSETVIGLWPMKKSEAPRIIKRLQVLK